MLALGIRYLNGYVAATEPDDHRRAEWPPHPGRVFMALAAAHFQTGRDPDERKALLWLEGLKEEGEPAAPQIVAPTASQRAVVTQYVPVNDDSAGCKKKQGKTVVFQEIGQTGLRRNRQDRTFARAWLVEGDTVYLTWPGFEPDPSTRAALDGLCAKVTRIGHSTSLVQMWLAESDEPGEATWVPDDALAEIHLRLAPAGTLEYLERQFNGEAVEEYAALKVTAADPTDKKAQRAARKRLREEYPDGAPPQLRPSLSVYQGYGRPRSDEAQEAAPGSAFTPHLIALRLVPVAGPFRQLDLACTLSIAGRWREALLSHSNDLSEAVRSVLSGHDAHGVPLEDPHLALAPLSFVGHAHADGHLLGVGAFLPRDLSREDRHDVLRALSRVHELKLGRLGVWRLETVTEARPPWNLRARAWTAHARGAREWSTVTPVAFDRHPKVKGKAAYRAEVAQMIAQCCTRIGLPRPEQVIVTPVSAHLGVPPAHAFPRLHRKDGGQRRHTHAIVVFDEPVQGPILLGAGRYRGYGLCRPLDGPGERGDEP
ncbi:MAG TPA: type I-U CRISPR-associated protein Cas5/Cas6 [Polyangiaceae bacterium]|nr:type I-U CRISPR-associated protein Cas5/Cas6 [Polyangiaceae bacterium]